MRAPYRWRPHGSRRRWAAAVLVLLLAVVTLPPAQAARSRQVKADGRWHKFEVRAPEQVLPFLFEVTAGCRYRLTVEGRGLPRVLVEAGPGDTALFSVDSRPPDAVPGAAPEDAPPPPSRPTAVVTWYAENSSVFEARVRGFSAMTGKGRLRLQTLGPDGEPVKAHRRLLAPGGTLAQVGSLWVGDANLWDLVVDPGATYEVRTLPGTAGRIALAVLGADDRRLAAVEPSSGAPYPRLRFTVPEPLPEEEPEGLRLSVAGVDGGGGTYGVRLRQETSSSTHDGTDDGTGTAASPAVETGLVEEVPLGFRANPGDLAVLFLPQSHAYDPHPVERLRDGTWTRLPPDAVTPHGERASMRTPEQAALVWFRPFEAGTYRFRQRRTKGARLSVVPAEDVPRAPLLLGTGHDPTVNAHGRGGWRTIGVGVCMPGWDYLYVAVGRRRASVSMRIRYAPAPGEPLRTRRALGGTHVAGLGPSLRFRLKAPALVRLEVKGRAWTGYALLRRAGN